MPRTVEDILMTNDYLRFKRFPTTRLLYKMCLVVAVPFLASERDCSDRQRE